ncbi:MAG TPA: ATP-dependent DNA ligase [Bryobacteraceae bacterium]|jgi:ATP-dependent DNA ligase|nr:ATP-dependent DNA ligase [Bryobacteraceae bacterium]
MTPSPILSLDTIVFVHLPVNPPVLPMLAKRIEQLPPGEEWIFEPKWDGFRALVFRDDDEIFIQSRDEKPLNRYFPELLEPLRKTIPRRCVLDGEIVIVKHEGLDFDQLQLRLHPAESRVRKLAAESPSSVVFFDVLAEGDRDFTQQPFEKRRAHLERILASAKPPVHLTPATRDRALAEDWFNRFEGAGFDGVVAKHIESVYEPNKRVMFKIKHERDCDCVVAGFRWHKKGEGSVGSLLLGLYDDSGALQHVGVCSSFSADRRQELAEFLEPYRKNALANHPWKAWAGRDEESGAPQRMPGGQSRWSQGKDLSWEPLRPELVVEVAYDHMQGDRFRHVAQFRRWRPDKKPADCTYAQLEVVPPQELFEIFGAKR